MKETFFSRSLDLWDYETAIDLKVVSRIAGAHAFGERHSFKALGQLRSRTDHTFDCMSFIVGSKFSELGGVVKLVDGYV